MEIKNVVFDFGQVIVHFEPEYMVGQYVESRGDKELLCEVLFDRLYWDKLDKGTIEDEQVISLSNQRLDEKFHHLTEKIYYNWIYNIPEMEGMRELIRDIKKTFGVKTCLLSDISRYFSEHRHEIPILAELDQLVLSADYKLAKPHRATFENLFAVCDIRPEESVFVDDLEANIEGARKAGLQGYLFDGDAKKLLAYLETVLA